MKTIYTLCFAALGLSLQAQNTMPIPSTLTGENISLTLQEGTTDFYQGITTNTMGANGNLLGPTLIVHKDSALSISVNNQLSDTTTIHWHGMHVAPENDGGPHSIILPGATWNPQFTVMDKAGLCWYHPHLHMRTDEHVSKGIAGLIIVRDEEESTLGLPMDYGVDEFPIVLQTKGFDSNGQIEIHTEMDTSVLVNGVVNATTDFPAQIVRMRVLNGSTQRIMEFGFSDNRSFSLIGTDGGLLSASLSMTRYRLSPGQRIDVLLDLSTDQGGNFQLMSFGSELPNAIYGAAQPGMGSGATIPGYADNPLNGSDFALLDINVVAPTSNPVSSIPSTLAVHTPLLEANANVTRELTFTAASGMGNIVGPFLINGAAFEMDVINYTIPLDNIEIWSLTNQTPIAHPFHIHDVQFYILDINGNPPPPELQGLNDVVLVPAGQGNVRFIAQFNDFANDTIPYMYHCHMLTHEDMGMMGQFIVSETAQNIKQENINDPSFLVYPNPSNEGYFTIDLKENDRIFEEVNIFDYQGKLILSKNISKSIIQIQDSKLDGTGMYFISLKDSKGATLTRKIIVQ